jgi:hypothetical protein
MDGAASAAPRVLHATPVAGPNTHFGTDRLKGSILFCHKQTAGAPGAPWPDSLPERLTNDLHSTRLALLPAREGDQVGLRLFNLTQDEVTWYCHGDLDPQGHVAGKDIRRIPGLDGHATSPPFALPGFFARPIPDA